MATSWGWFTSWLQVEDNELITAKWITLLSLFTHSSWLQVEIWVDYWMNTSCFILPDLTLTQTLAYSYPPTMQAELWAGALPDLP
jgi:hypothetical protein